MKTRRKYKAFIALQVIAYLKKEIMIEKRISQFAFKIALQMDIKYGISCIDIMEYQNTPYISLIQNKKT
jgi:hypothetical protein